MGIRGLYAIPTGVIRVQNPSYLFCVIWTLLHLCLAHVAHQRRGWTRRVMNKRADGSFLEFHKDAEMLWSRRQSETKMETSCTVTPQR